MPVAIISQHLLLYLSKHHCPVNKDSRKIKRIAITIFCFIIICEKCEQLSHKGNVICLFAKVSGNIEVP